MTIIAIILTTLSTLVVVGNIYGCISARQDRKKGIERGYSNIPIVSLLLGLIAWFVGRHALGVWPIIPSLFDPGTWLTLYLPWAMWKEFIKKDERT